MSGVDELSRDQKCRLYLMSIVRTSGTVAQGTSVSDVSRELIEYYHPHESGVNTGLPGFKSNLIQAMGHITGKNLPLLTSVLMNSRLSSYGSDITDMCGIPRGERLKDGAGWAAYYFLRHMNGGASDTQDHAELTTSFKDSLVTGGLVMVRQ